MGRGFAHILLPAGVDVPNMIRTSVQHTASAQNVAPADGNSDKGDGR